MTWHTVLKVLLAVVLIPLWLFGQFIRGRSVYERDRKSGIETLMGEKK